MHKRSFFAAVLVAPALVLCLFGQSRTPPPRPLLPIPTARQLAWQYDEMRLFVHFGVNTYTNREWGTGKEDPRIFNPARLDARQWALVARETGFKTIILTAKHHDGFCLWPSRYTTHSVASGTWEGGKGDVVRELFEATRDQRIRMGLYLSPWDMHEPVYGDENAYNSFYLGQLRELLSGYGRLAEVWFDGAKGKDAKDMNYDFAAFWATVRQLQPEAVMFSDEGPDVRWIGNERGFAGETNWSTIDRTKVKVGKADTKYLNSGEEGAPDWIPGECDTSIRKGWFWHPEEQPKSLEQLVEIYFKSVGRNGVLLLNVPPNTEGRFDEHDVKRLHEFRQALDAIFGKDFAGGKTTETSAVRGNSPEFDGTKAVDGDLRTYWAQDDARTGGTLELDLGGPATFDVVRIQEPVALGQRISGYRVEALQSGEWKTITQGTTVGHKKLDRIASPVTASKVRLVIEKSRATPLVAEFGLHKMP